MLRSLIQLVAILVDLVRKEGRSWADTSVETLETRHYPPRYCWPSSVSACGGAAQSRAAEPEGIAGRVVDTTGAGVAAAKVWVVGGGFDDPKAIAEATTDGQGAFSFPDLWGEPDREGTAARLTQPYGLVAQDGGRIGWLASVNMRNQTPIKIELVETGEARGRLVDTAGKPIAGAEIVPSVFIRSHDKGSSVDYLRLTPALARPLATTTADDGSFTLRGIPRGSKVQAMLSTRGFGAPRVSWDTTKDVTIALDGRLGRIEGRLVTPDAREPGSEISLSVRRSSPSDEAQGGAFTLLYFKTIQVGGDGRFRFDELPPGRYVLSTGGNKSSGYMAEPIPDVEVVPNARVDGLNVALRRLLTITGRIVDASSGEGIAGVTVNAWHLVGNRLQSADGVEADAQGRYTVHVGPGKVLIQPRSIPRSHLGLDTEACPRFDVTADRDWPDIKLPRAVTLDGIVVDLAGQPVAGAEVHLVRPNPIGFADDGSIKTAADGSFRLEQLDPDDTLPVRARTKEATTDGAIVIRPGKQSGKLTLTLDPKTATRIHGVVSDRSGKPVPGATVMLWWNRDYVSEKTRFSGVGSVLENYKTDGDGHFASTALWPGDSYHVNVSAEGYGKAESPAYTGRAGEDHDLGTIQLVGTSSNVAGRVVDSVGKPVEGATVFNRGDGPDAVTTRTDAGGKYRLDGLFVGGKYVFARKNGYRFTVGRVERESDDLTIRLLRLDEPPPPWKPVKPATPEEERALAKRVLTKLWDRYGKNASKNGAFVCILHMAQIDPPLALKWSSQAGGRYDARVSQEAAEALAETDADGALELLTAPGVGSSQYILQRLAERFAGEDRAKALKFAEEAAVQARAMEQPDRAGAMAKAGAVLVRLGRKEAGLALVNEAAEAAARMGFESRQAYARGNVAGALAPFDVERALALVEPMKTENDRDRYLGFIATALAETDPERALAVAGKIGERSSAPQSVKVAIAYALGRSNRTDEAVRVIQGMKGYAAEKYQVEAYGWLAVAVAPRDKVRAADFIDRALTVPVDRPQEFESWTYFGAGTGSAAWVAVCAERAGYPDMAGVVARVLASRPSDRHRDPSMEAQSQTIAAAILALTDPSAGGQILRDLETRSGLRSRELRRVADRRWLMAWALADPKHAEELFEAEFTALEGAREVDLQSGGLLKMAEILAIPRRRREQFLRREIGATWYPDIEE